MEIVVDIIMFAIIIISVWLGYMKGFTKLAISFLAFIIAIAVTLVLYKPVTAFVIDNTQIDETIKSTIITEATDFVQEDSENELSTQIVTQAATGILNETADIISINIVTVGVIIILFILIRVGLIFAKFIADVITKIPVIKQIDKFGGVLYGLLRGILIIYTILLILSFIGEINAVSPINTTIKDSYVTSLMYEHNILKFLL